MLISDRNSIVAELHKPYSRTNLSGSINPLLLAWAQSGIVSLPKGEKQPLEPIRTLDAIHLATALIFMRVYPSLEIFTYDQRILKNANALGIVPAATAVCPMG